MGRGAPVGNALQSLIPRQVMMLVNGCKDAGTGLTS